MSTEPVRTLPAWVYHDERFFELERTNLFAFSWHFGCHVSELAKPGEVAENPYGQFVTPIIVSWYTVLGDGVSNEQMRNKLNAFDYGSAIVPLKDSNFLTNLNTYKPESYPEFTQASVEASNPFP